MEEELCKEMHALKKRVQSSLAVSAKAKQRKLPSVYLASWLTSKGSCGLHRTNQHPHLKVHPHRAF